jgi:biotin carboxylase
MVARQVILGARSIPGCPRATIPATPVRPDGRLPLLVVPYGSRVPPLQLAEVASGLCRILWLFDESLPENASLKPLLTRVGTVVNVAGLSPEETASVLREHSPDGVVAYGDKDIEALSRVAFELGLHYHTPQVARNLLDKLSQREALRNGGLASPLCWTVPTDRSPAGLAALAEAVDFPAVLKPRTGTGSRYAMLVADADALVSQVANLPPQAVGGKGMFVEQYLPGLTTGRSGRFADFVSVESLVAHGGISHLAVNGRLPFAEPFRETGTFIPADLSPAQQAAVFQLAGEALRALGLETGFCHTEIKLTPDGPRVIEVNGRLGGGVHEMLLRASSVSLLELSIRAALGKPVVVEGPIPCDAVGWRLMRQPPTSARRIAKVEGLGRLAKLAGVDTVFLNRAPGDAIDWREGTGDFVFDATGVSADHEGLLEVNRFLHEEISVEYD